MKRLILLLLFVSNHLNAQHVQISFDENFNIFVPWGGSPNPDFGSTTSDSVINSIFTTHNVTVCYQGVGEGNPFNGPQIFSLYEGVDINQFISDLESNPNVISAKICPQEYVFADVLFIQLSVPENGIPISINENGNVVTNSSALNLIFEQYQVKNMTSYVPTVLSGNYTIYFEGDILNLKTELENMNEIIEFTEFSPLYFLLSTENFDSKNITVFPNPFANTISIETSEAISNYALFDVSGKQIVNSPFKINLDITCSSIATGIYFLQLQSESGHIFNQKIIKK